MGSPSTTLAGLVEPAELESAGHTRQRLSAGALPAQEFRTALSSIAPVSRDAWLDAVLGLGPPPPDGPHLPRECVPYLPCPVDALLRLVDLAEIGADDVFVDVGAGVGRAAALVSLLTGAKTVGIEVQPELVAQARALAARFPGLELSMIQGDATQLAQQVTSGTVFFFYCPFDSGRFERVLDGLEPLARSTRLRVATVDLPVPFRPWLAQVKSLRADLSVFQSVR